MKSDNVIVLIALANRVSLLDLLMEPKPCPKSQRPFRTKSIPTECKLATIS